MTPLRIVVADDDCHIRDLVTDILEEAGYTVEAYGDGLSALAAIRVNPPAVALFDVAMPVMTGGEALQAIQRAGLGVPIVIMTAGTQPQRFLQPGAVSRAAEAVWPRRPAHGDHTSLCAARLPPRACGRR